jgi:hypothetical protein
MAHRFSSSVQDLEEMSSELTILSDSDDADYNPGVEDHQMSMEALFIPHLRRSTMSTTASEKQKARESDPKGGRCLVSNERDPSCAIEVCHLLPKATGKKDVSPIYEFYSSLILTTSPPS